MCTVTGGMRASLISNSSKVPMLKDTSVVGSSVTQCVVTTLPSVRESTRRPMLANLKFFGVWKVMSIAAGWSKLYRGYQVLVDLMNAQLSSTGGMARRAGSHHGGRNCAMVDPNPIRLP